MGDSMAQVGTTAASVLALVLSLLNLYLQRRDRRPRLKIRVRYEYQVGASEAASPAGSQGVSAAPQVHDESQEGLYLRLGDFLREHGVEYPHGSAVVRFAISNEGERVAYLNAVRLVFREGGP